MTDAYVPLRGPQFDKEGAPGDDERKSELLSMFERWDVALAGKWGSWVEEAKQAYDFAAGHQWVPEDRAAMEDNGKIPVVFNITAPTLDAVAGAEIQNRQQTQYFPREIGDQGVADALTQGAKYINDECNGDMEDSEAFYDTLICGIGWTESAPDIDGDNIDIIKGRVDPIEMRVDPSSRKPNFEDKRYLKREMPMSRDGFEEYMVEIGQPADTDPDGYSGTDSGKRLTIVNPRTRYTSGMLGNTGNDEVTVCEWQWYEKKPVFLAPMPSPDDGNVVKVGKLGPDEFAEARRSDPNLPHSRSTEKVFYRAITANGELLFEETLPEKAFRYNAITGKRDRNKGTWFGLVRAMLDPQKFTNKLYSEILHIVRTNANGGLMMEEDAVADIRKFEATWAAADKITWIKPGALSNAQGPKVQPKQATPINPALFSLMEFARDMVKACTGVNEEILGLVGREQAGVLEAQRKQAAYGILSAFFDAKRRYQRDYGRLLLSQMRVFLPDDKLVRIVDKGTEKYVQVAKTLEAQEYDIIVDEAPTGPNQKQKVMAVMGPLLPELFAQGLIGPEEVADMLPFMDLPAAVSSKLAEGIRKRAQQPNPTGEAMEKAQVEGAAVDIENTRADTDLKRAGAAEKMAKAQNEGQSEQAAQAEIQGKMAKTHADVAAVQMKTQAQVQAAQMKAASDAQLAERKAASDEQIAQRRGQADVVAKMMGAESAAEESEARTSVIGKQGFGGEDGGDE